MFNQKLYRNTIEELRAPQDKIEEVIAMTQNHSDKKSRHPLRMAAVAAAAVALLTIGVSAANPEGIQSFLYDITTTIRLDDFLSRVTTEDGTEISLLDISNITVETRGDEVVLIAGSEKIDVTDELAQNGRYEYVKNNGTSEVRVEIIGTPQDFRYSVALGEAGDENAPVFSFDSKSPHDVTIGGSDSGVSYQWGGISSGEGEGAREGTYIVTDTLPSSSF